jgi:nitroreductase
LVTESPEPLYKGIIGPYGKIKGAPSFIAFIGDMDGPNVQEQIGYTSEGIILEAEAMHVATCWVGGFYRKDIVASLINMKQTEEVLGITPIGYAMKRQATTERLITGFGLTHRRKSLPTIATGLKEADWSVWIKAALEAARLAPSAGKHQPWRFHIEPNSILITVNKP